MTRGQRVTVETLHASTEGTYLGESGIECYDGSRMLLVSFSAALWPSIVHRSQVRPVGS